MLALSLAAGIATAFAGRAIPGSGIGSQAGISPLHYALAQGPVILRYLRMLVLPWGFTVDPDIHVPGVALGLLAWVAITALVLVAHGSSLVRHRGTTLERCATSGLVLLLTSSSIFPAADLAADRRMYLPMIAFSTALGLVLSKVRWPYVVVAALAVLSFYRTTVWHSEQSLWSDAVSKAPHKARPLLQLARATGGQRGLELLEQAKTIAPNDPDIPSEEGRIDLAMGKPQDALVAFGRALALQPHSAEAYNNRGVALLLLGQRDAARTDFDRALRIDPCQPDARLNLSRLGVALPGCYDQR